MKRTALLTSVGVWAGGEEYSKYKQQVVEMVKAGQLVVQMLAAEETIAMPDGSRKATFTQETWDMVRHPWKSCQNNFKEMQLVMKFLASPKLQAMQCTVTFWWCLCCAASAVLPLQCCLCCAASAVLPAPSGSP